MTNTVNSKIKPNEIYIERLYEAPLKMVWEAWVDSTQAANWWGPRGFTITNHSKDVRTDGHWHYTMHGPDGVDYPNKTKYLEVEPFVRMVYDHGGNDTQAPLFRVTVNFIDLNGKTKMEMTMALPTAEAAVATKKFIKQAAGNTTWDRLAEHLEYMISQKDIFVINQTFSAPIDRLFNMWADPNHLKHWMGPAEANIKYLRADVKPGGSAFYCMTGLNNSKIYGKANYLEIKRPSRMLYTQVFCDENETTTRHPMAPTWPEVMRTTLTLESESSDSTRATITWEIEGNASTAERGTFHNAKAGMSQGWAGSFDKLEAYLASLS